SSRIHLRRRGRFLRISGSAPSAPHQGAVMYSPEEGEMIARINIQEHLAEAEHYRLAQKVSVRPPSLCATLGNWRGGALASGINDAEGGGLRSDGIQDPHPTVGRQG